MTGFFTILSFNWICAMYIPEIDEGTWVEKGNFSEHVAILGVCVKFGGCTFGSCFWSGEASSTATHSSGMTGAPKAVLFSQVLLEWDVGLGIAPE